MSKRQLSAPRNGALNWRYLSCSSIMSVSPWPLPQQFYTTVVIWGCCIYYIFLEVHQEVLRSLQHFKLVKKKNETETTEFSALNGAQLYC